jgi:hypothetical protein
MKRQTFSLYILFIYQIHAHLHARYLNNRVGYRAGKFTITIKYVV